MNLYEIFSILVLHWISDFVLQTDEDAKGKSKSFKRLISHTASYSIFWVTPTILYAYILDTGWVLLFPLITFVCHTATDYYTSKVNSQLWEENKVHSFFVSIGFDQLLHYFQLFTTFYFLKTV